MNDQSSTPASASEKPAPSDTDLLFEPNISINGVIDDNTVSFFLGRLQEVRRAGADMIVELNTDGGDADAARRIALEVRLFRRHSGRRTYCLGKTKVYSAGVTIFGLRIGRTELIVTLVGLAAIALVAGGLRYSSLGRQVRALSDSIELSETTGIDTDRIVLVTWAISGGLAGLAGIIYALPAGTVNPQLGFTLILSIFAAVVVGGIGNAYGALAGGMLIGVAQEWSTLVIDPSMKVAVGFAVLILVLLVRPQGLFGRARSVER